MNDLLVDRLKNARTNQGLKQQDVAEQLGIKANTISNWEKGRTEPGIDTFVKLCDIYQLDCASLLSEVYAFNRISKDITLPEYEHIKKYRDLDDHGREMVDFTLTKEYERSIALAKEKESIPNVMEFPDHLKVKAAHERTDIEVTNEMKQHDDDIMESDDF